MNQSIISINPRNEMNEILITFIKAIDLTTLLLAREINLEGIQYAHPRYKRLNPSS
jgi:hypothetical protein